MLLFWYAIVAFVFCCCVQEFLFKLLKFGVWNSAIIFQRNYICYNYWFCVCCSMFVSCCWLRFSFSVLYNYRKHENRKLGPDGRDLYVLLILDVGSCGDGCCNNCCCCCCCGSFSLSFSRSLALATIAGAATAELVISENCCCPVTWATICRAVDDDEVAAAVDDKLKTAGEICGSVRRRLLLTFRNIKA